MDATWAAVVTGAFALLMILIERGRRENVKDHGYVVERLDDLKADIKEVDADLAVIEYKLDTHMNDVELHSELLLKKPKKIK